MLLIKNNKLLTSTLNNYILCMCTVIIAPSVMDTLVNSCLISCTLKMVEPYRHGSYRLCRTKRCQLFNYWWITEIKWSMHYSDCGRLGVLSLIPLCFFAFFLLLKCLKYDSTHHFFRNACTKSGSLRFSQFSDCWLILSVYILMSFDFPFVRLFGVR
jgi:hypothetical protein